MIEVIALTMKIDSRESYGRLITALLCNNLRATIKIPHSLIAK